jgi:CRISPR-associated protein Csb2
MTRFALVVEYLTGYAVATDPSNREIAEWPPHPARVFMALAAAHFEFDDSATNKQAEREALEWLEALDPPSLSLPGQAAPNFGSARQSLTVFVPVNDVTGIEALPTSRPRQPRMFPRVFVGDSPIRFIWTAEETRPEHLDTLEGICGKVTRIGHSSSLVWVRLERDVAAEIITHQPSNDASHNRLRITSGGALKRLKDDFNANDMAAFSDLERRAQAATLKKEAVAARRTLAERFPSGRPSSKRPVFSISRGYRPVQSAEPAVTRSPFDPNLIILRESDDSPQSYGLESTLLLTHALRGLIQQKCGIQPVPDWVSGHNGPNGPKLSDGRGHIALVPLPFVQQWRRDEQQFADGHIMGLAIVFPRDVAISERAKAFAPILFDEHNDPNTLKLTLGGAGEFHVERETSLSPKLNLRPITWTKTSRRWISVTPVVLDRIPKSNRGKDRVAWTDEVAQIVCTNCKRQNLPEPIAVRIEKTPLLIGSRRAMPGQGGFPLLRPGTFQVHAEIEFSVPVEGPILLGAGRFRGYGICRPAIGEV